MKLFFIMLTLVGCNVFGSSNSDDKEIFTIAQSMVESSISNAVARVGNRIALGNIEKKVDDLVWPAQQIKRAQQYENLKQDIVHHQKSMQDSLIKIKENAIEAKPFLLSKDHGSAMIDSMVSRLDGAIISSNNDDVQNITQEFLHVLNNEGLQLESLAHAQEIKEQTQRSIFKSIHQKAVWDTVKCAQKKIKSFAAKEQQEKKIRDEEKNKQELLTAQKASLAQSLVQREQIKKITVVSIDPVQELDAIIHDAQKILDTPMTYDAFKDTLAYVEKAVKSAALKDCKSHISAINTHICTLHILHKDVKKIDKKNAKNKSQKMQHGVDQLMSKALDLIDMVGSLAIMQKARLMPCQASSSSSSSSQNSNKEYGRELALIRDRATVLIKQQFSVQMLDDVRSFIKEVMPLSYVFENGVRNELQEQLIVPTEGIYRAVVALVTHGESSHSSKIFACMDVMTANYVHVLKEIKVCVEKKLAHLSQHPA